jgi:mono/diheme cytochrome c family protein
MRSRSRRALVYGAISVAVALIAQAQHAGHAAQLDDWAKHEYDTHCAVCHGLGGKGDGVFAAQLKSGTVVPDLTGLSSQNNGVFPFKRVYEAIDSGKLSGHGAREMPIWGARYVHTRILGLTRYIGRLQAK